MAIINAKAFAKKTGYPLAMVRAFCREGKISHWQRGRVYLIEENEALAEMQMLKTSTIHKKKNLSKPQIVRKPVETGKFDFRQALKQMKAECKK